MKSIGWRIGIAIFALSCSWPQCCFGDDGCAQKKSAVQVQIIRLKSQPSNSLREQEAGKLYDIVSQNKDAISEYDINAIANLLSDPDDNVRAIAANSLGSIGPRANSAIPSLNAALKMVECNHSDLSSKPDIVIALQKLGAPPWMPPVCTQSIFRSYKRGGN